VVFPQNASQQSARWTLGILPRFQAFSWLRVFLLPGRVHARPPTLILLSVELIEACPENIPGAGIASKDTPPPRPDKNILITQIVETVEKVGRISQESRGFYSHRGPYGKIQTTQ
jgi:hypothetical protein